MIVDMEATLARVQSVAPRNEDESDSQYAARTLHLAYMVIEHGTPVFMPEQEEKVENE